MAIELHLKKNEALKTYLPSTLLISKENYNLHLAQRYFYAGVYADKEALKKYINEDIYFYDLYITYHNFHQDVPTK
ncbi:hypothetical protein [Epilithonimonas zeae]|uniref:hypothetical protein n=1 Tax=Epilithonimonas zeae TaxID=1416779 RepID=UPI0020108B81|nr:hypothetical protein [Epilithonimonas zeae]UQB69147.1 hypothetical protein KI430_01515 [Epilithonimonas zeae]